MSYSSRESSIFQGQPFELYLFESAEEAWRLASGDKVRSLGGHEYTPTPVKRSTFGRGPDQKANNMTVTIPRDHELAELFVGFLPASPISLVVYRGHEGEDESQTQVKFTGAAVSAAFGEDCDLICAPEERILQQKIPRTRYQTPCNKIIYSAACGVDRELWRTPATLLSVSDDTLTADEFAAHPDGWFTNGYIEWGQFKRMIIRHVGNAITLIVPLAGIEAGAEVSAFPGCARTYTAACRGKFSNGPNFWGFEWIPRRNPFKGVEW